MNYPPIFKGLTWQVTIIVTNAPPGADQWTWMLKIDDSRDATGFPTISQPAESTSQSGSKLTLQFEVSATDTDKLNAETAQLDLTYTKEEKEYPAQAFSGHAKVVLPVASAD